MKNYNCFLMPGAERSHKEILHESIGQAYINLTVSISLKQQLWVVVPLLEDLIFLTWVKLRDYEIVFKVASNISNSVEGVYESSTNSFAIFIYIIFFTKLNTLHLDFRFMYSITMFGMSLSFYILSSFFNFTPL